ncbi:glycosyltransferase family 2 protein [Shewanella oncorhynchi]|uniref:glycosyltransferase family 2 protein n=1 Tax=Shewanella oncorhynchi TaxID=2726434 RepID=UPI003D7AC5E0
MNENISICITTYQRGEILDDVLDNIVRVASNHDVAIYVSDNASSDCTEEVLKKYKKIYPYFFYNINSENIGFDRSFEVVMNMAKSKYIWTMADYSFIKEDSIERLLGIIKSNNDLDLIALNNSDRVVNIKSQLYTDRNLILSEIGWHITLLDSLVWNKKIVENGSFNRFYGTLFGYLGVALEYVGNVESRVYWDSCSYINGTHPEKSSLWFKNAIEVWAKNFTELVLSLPQFYSLESKLTLIRAHGERSKLFSLRSLISLRGQGAYSFFHYRCYKLYLGYALNFNSLTLLIIAITPKRLVQYLKHKFN